MNNPIIIRKGLKLGELDAEADQELLSECFIDTGELSRLMSVSDPAAIVLGRTGSGKSALLLQVARTAEHSAFLNPNDISVRFLEHSNIIQFLSELGINLDLFYRVLWRHILIVELLRLRYDLKSELDNKNFLKRLYQVIDRDPVKEKAFTYFSEWGDKFWLETDEQLREITKKFASEVKSKLGAKHQAVDVSLEGARSLSNEQRTEVTNRASQVVSAIQIKRLNEVFDLLAEEVFSDKQKKYYVLIDALDENWAETETRVRFIRALIEELKSFRKLEQVKIIPAMRRDLLDFVFDKTRDAGFQEEKYEAYLLRLRWSKADLKTLLERRINEVFRRQYTRDDIRFSDLFPSPKKGGGITADEYIVERTLLRPRDILQFANECFLIAADRERVSWRTMFAAEAIYSSKRIKSLREEWDENYPCLEEFIEVLRRLPSPFTRSLISGDRLESVLMTLSECGKPDPCAKVAIAHYQPGQNSSTEAEVVSTILQALYHIGAIGIKISSLETFIWSHVDQPQVSKSEIKRTNQIKVHKMLHQTLEIRPLDHEFSSSGKET